MRSCPLCLSNKSRKDHILNNIGLLKCNNCSFVFADIEKEINEKTNSAYDDKAVESYEHTQDTLDQRWMEEIVRKMTRKIGKGRVLDVGCGNGLLLSVFKKYGWNCVGVDLSPWSEQFAEKYDFELLRGKIEKMELENESFDLVTSTSTLEHIFDPVPHIRRIIELIKPGGAGYFSGIPNYDSLSIKCDFSAFNSNHPPGHTNYFTPRTMRNAFDLANCKLKKIKIKTYGIPELYRMKRFINSKKKSINGVSPKPKKAKIIKNNFAADVLIKMNYVLGRPFSVGDKIEVNIEK